VDVATVEVDSSVDVREVADKDEYSVVDEIVLDNGSVDSE
jgi:hypothetical protein